MIDAAQLSCRLSHSCSHPEIVVPGTEHDIKTLNRLLLHPVFGINCRLIGSSRVRPLLPKGIWRVFSTLHIINNTDRASLECVYSRRQERRCCNCSGGDFGLFAPQGGSTVHRLSSNLARRKGFVVLDAILDFMLAITSVLESMFCTISVPIFMFELFLHDLPFILYTNATCTVIAS